MDINARLYYHLKQKEEELEANAKKLESFGHELQIQKREVEFDRKQQEVFAANMKERIENTHLLFQTKMENLNTLLMLKEEGWKQRMDLTQHEQQVKELLHGEEIARLNQEIEMRGIVHENEKVLGQIEHERELFSLDEVIAQKMQDIYMLQRDIQDYEHKLSFKEGELSLVREQSVLENKKGQILQAMYQQLSKESEWKEQYLSRLEEMRAQEYALKEKGLEIYLQEKNFSYGVREENLGLTEKRLGLKEDKIEIKKHQLEADRTYNDAYRKNIDSAYAQMTADILLKQERLEKEENEKSLKAKEWYLDHYENLVQKGKSNWQEKYNAERTWYAYWKQHNTLQHDINVLTRDEARLRDKVNFLNEQAQSLEREKAHLSAEIQKLKGELPEGEKK